ncbi:MAG: protease inhibitor Inh/omp19 family protein [Caulobacteraceae bacterium]|nr:protease inhibitor Inh/omp19 family protein [Caulobacteraceae bacterium]
MKLNLLGAAAALLMAVPALAADWPDSPDALGGTWTMDGLTEGSDSCVFQLGVDETIGGWTINLPNTCKRSFPVLTAVTAWRVNPETGAIVLADAERHAVLEFERAADGGYVAHPGDGSDATGLAIQKGDPAERHPPTPQEAMTGTWRISALGAAHLCTFELTSDAKGRSGQITVRQPCSSEWAGRPFTRWSISGKTISLNDARGNSILEFRRVDQFTFERTSSDDPYSRRGEMMFFGKVF